MSPWFRRRRRSVPPELPPAAEAPAGVSAEPDPGLAEPDPGSAEPVQEPDPTGPLSPDRLDNALKRLRQEIPAPSEESPPEPSA